MPTAPIPLLNLAAALFVASWMSADLRAAPPDIEPAPPAPRRSPPAPTRADLNRPWPRTNLDDAELAGLSRGSRMERLDWERAYALALVRSRASRPAQGRVLAEALDPNTLAEQAERYGVRDFSRFRKDFLADYEDDVDREAEGRLRDPSGAILELLRRRQTVEIARWNVAAFENLIKVLQELIEKVSSGVSQLQLDLVSESLQLARVRLLDEREHYRNHLDALKVDLGLSPHAPIALDGSSLAGFRDTFAEADRWSADPKAEPTELPRIAHHLPLLGDVAIEDQSVDAVLTSSREGPSDRQEELLRAGTRVALKARGDRGDAGARVREDARLELKVRGDLRRLLWIRVAYIIEVRRFVLVLRRRDQAQERLFAPPRIEESQPQRAELITELIGVQGQIAENQARLVSLWTEYQAKRLALYRVLGTLPCDDWKSFYDQLTARQSADTP